MAIWFARRVARMEDEICILFIEKHELYIWFDVLTAVNIKTVVFSDMTPCSLLDGYQLYRFIAVNTTIN
jgi:hypothetical protein